MTARRLRSLLAAIAIGAAASPVLASYAFQVFYA